MAAGWGELRVTAVGGGVWGCGCLGEEGETGQGTKRKAGRLLPAAVCRLHGAGEALPRVCLKTEQKGGILACGM